MKKIMFLSLFLLLFFNAKTQEKGSIIIGVTSQNTTQIAYSTIKSQVLNQFGSAIKKIEICTNHSLLHIVVDINAKPCPSALDVLNYLINNFPNYQFFDKIIHEDFNSLNCKWQ